MAGMPVKVVMSRKTDRNFILVVFMVFITIYLMNGVPLPSISRVLYQVSFVDLIGRERIQILVVRPECVV